MEGGDAGGCEDKDLSSSPTRHSPQLGIWRAAASADDGSRGGRDPTLQQAKPLSSPAVGAMSQAALGGVPPDRLDPRAGACPAWVLTSSLWISGDVKGPFSWDKALGVFKIQSLRAARQG